ncbi:MAG: glycine cleavage system aminomethyltransferase GcvT [Candidatus Rokuibacteriota bacterium]
MTATIPAGTLKRTPLHDAHVAAGAKMVPFGGWEMPVQYRGIIEEHRAVRGAVGLFDISHMGEFEVEGPGALAAVQRLTTNDASTLEVGQVQYSVLCHDDGGIVDDLTVYRLAADRFMLVVNAANIDGDWAWVTARGAGDARWRDVSVETALLAVQGPRAERVVGGLADVDVAAVRYYHFARGRVAGVPAVCSRTGYTGEDGFELYVPAGDAPALWRALLTAGRDAGIQPIGLGARDTLRLEMKFALYGNDIDRTTNPLEAGLGWVVKPAKGEFVGRPAIEAARAAGLGRKLVGFEMTDRAVPRHGYPILAGGGPAGRVTSGSFSPSLERSIGMGYVKTERAAIGAALEVEIRGQAHPARVVKTPFHPSKAKK